KLQYSKDPRCLQFRLSLSKGEATKGAVRFFAIWLIGICLGFGIWRLRRDSSVAASLCLPCRSLAQNCRGTEAPPTFLQTATASYAKATASQGAPRLQLPGGFP